MSPSRVKEDLRILAPIGMLGYGYSEEIFWSAVNDGVDVIIADSGSTDGGPSKLATGSTTMPKANYERDLSIFVAAAHSHKIPILIGSAGGDGSNAHVDLFVDIISDIINKNGYRSMKVVTIYAEVPKDTVHHRHKIGRIEPCSKAVPELSSQDIDDSTRIVAQMGLEPFVKAMELHPDFDIIIAGRAYDPSPFAAFCLHNGFADLGLNYHMGKILECGALCSTPKSKEALGIMRHDSFDIVPLDPKSRCTVTSVAAHTLYEKTRPDLLIGPGGVLQVAGSTYEQLPDKRSVRVSGATFASAPEGEYTLKLEGAKVRGFHSCFFGGIRDPILIAQIDQFLAQVKEYVKTTVDFEYELDLAVYGNNAVMGVLERDTTHVPKEICICGHARAASQSQATQVSSIARVACVHGPYPHQLATAGNFAMPFAPLDIPLGPLSEFCIYHIMKNVDPLEFFPIRCHMIHGDDRAKVVFPIIDSKSTSSATSASINGDVKGSTCQSIVSLETKNRPRPDFLKPPPPENSSYLGDIATVVRSKNAGPYELTMDVMFDSDEVYYKVKKSGVLSEETVAQLYQISPDDIIACVFWDPARAFKATIKRPMVSGSFGSLDVHGSAQHVPLLYLVLPLAKE